MRCGGRRGDWGPRRAVQGAGLSEASASLMQFVASGDLGCPALTGVSTGPGCSAHRHGTRLLQVKRGHGFW